MLEKIIQIGSLKKYFIVCAILILFFIYFIAVNHLIKFSELIIKYSDESNQNSSNFPFHFYNSIRKIQPTDFIESHPNFPKFLLMTKNLSNSIPPLEDIRWTGVHWQESNVWDPKFLLYSAHFYNHNGNSVVSNKSSIYVIGLYQGNKKPNIHFCQFYFNESISVKALPVASYQIIDYQEFSTKRLVPYLLNCSLIDGYHVPKAVSIVKTPFKKPSNLLHVTGTNSKLKNKNETIFPSIGICTPAIYYYYEDFSFRFIEWIELLYLIGVTKVILYKASVPEKLEKVLQYYKDRDMITIVDFHYPPPYVDEPALRKIWVSKKRPEMFAMENIYFTDCILRFKDQFDYLAHIDFDEMLVLKKHQNLPELLQYLRNFYRKDNHVPANFRLKWNVFYKDLKQLKLATNISEDFYILKHTTRISKVFAEVDMNFKSIFDTKQVRGVISHEALIYERDTKIKKVTLDPNIAYVAHFRSQPCGKICDSKKIVLETFFDQISNELISKVNQVVYDIDSK